MNAESKNKLPYPTKRLVGREQFLDMVSKGDWLVQRKYDGELESLDIMLAGKRCTLICEFMRRKSGGCYTAQDDADFADCGQYRVALTISHLEGQNLLGEPNGWRQEIMRELIKKQPLMALKLPLECNILQAEIFDRIMGAGAEGFVAHLMDGPWGPMICHKRGEIYTCQVLAVTQFKSIMVQETMASLDERSLRSTLKPPFTLHLAHGMVAVQDEKILGTLKVGDLVRIEALGQTAEGKLREGKLCREWKPVES